MRLREINNVKFFISWLNKEKGFDFVIDESFDDEQSYIDVIIRSKKFNRSINIQNVAYRDGTFYKYGESNIPGFKPIFVIGAAMSDTERRESIFQCIKKKEKKYPAPLVKNIILLIEITIPAITPEQIEKLFLGGITTDFVGVYFVQLPVTMPSIDDKYGKTGYVYPIKEMEI
jgi:hypothetical protein